MQETKTKYKSCDLMLHQIVLDQDDIRPCCCESINGNGTSFIKQYKGQLLSECGYIEKRAAYVEQYKNNQIPDCCTNCPIIEEKEWDEELYFNRIIIAHIAKCSCNCIYCVYTYNNPGMKKYYNTRKYYDIRPILLDLETKKLIKDNCEIIVGGGECTEFAKGELEWLLEFSFRNNCKISLLSSGIIFSKAINKSLEKSKAQLIVSPDSGTKKTYEKIKRVKAYDKFWNNMKKYVKSAQKNPLANVQLKYILIPEVNDTAEEIQAFLKKCRDIKCNNIQIDIEHHWFNIHKDEPVSENIKLAAECFKNLDNIDLCFAGETEYWFKEKLGFQ